MYNLHLYPHITSAANEFFSIFPIKLNCKIKATLFKITAQKLLFGFSDALRFKPEIQLIARTCTEWPTVPLERTNHIHLNQ